MDTGYPPIYINRPLLSFSFPVTISLLHPARLLDLKLQHSHKLSTVLLLIQPCCFYCIVQPTHGKPSRGLIIQSKEFEHNSPGR
ncbi:hypothetical protein FVER53590_29971 [Fusarium verticillioides]|nr:hypothetical protein FVER53263_20113 [Fusarium verticillioides]RBR05813.1 hypothetical protein FVER53590_29971 [Fusarium verticillioides]